MQNSTQCFFGGDVNVPSLHTENSGYMKNITEIRKMAEQLLEDSELFLVELKISGNNEIQVFIDSPAGVNIDTCGRFSRALEEQLDREEEDFELTVSSAGIGYPFKVPGQYLKNVGKRVSVKTTDNTIREGILLSYSPEEIAFEYEEKKAVEGKNKKETVKTTITISLGNIQEIRDVISFK